jgi:hypothetical protein
MIYLLIAVAVFLAWRQGRVWGARRALTLYRQGLEEGAYYGAYRGVMKYRALKPAQAEQEEHAAA